MPVEVGFIGTGNIANYHLNSLEKIGEARVTAVYDLAPERAEQVARRFGAKVFTDHRELIAQSGIQALYVCLPPFSHEDQEVLAAERGIALFVEKPVALTEGKARQVLAAVQQYGIITSSGYHWRHSPLTDRARELLRGKTIGMVQGYWHGSMPGVSWWRRLDQSGGQFVEQATHVVDLARYFAGDVRRVSATYATRVLGNIENFSVADVGSVNLEFENGIIGNISTSCMVGQGYTVGLHVLCQGLILEELANTLRVIQPGLTQEFRSNENPYLLEDRTFIEAVLSGNPNAIRAPYIEAVRTLLVTLAANQSAQTGQPVDVPTI
ncbi:MAG TPA: Gfo/Idh/MocA family oxidoreductase [Chloroflexota bacterium]|nr:Gfo/Idh/MocA family oxidoreductase [Chloroflexota bacterium]